MKAKVTFNTAPTRNPYEIDNVRKTSETATAFVVTTHSGEIIHFPWTSIAWARVETGVRS